MERYREPGGPIAVSQDVFDGIEAVRQSGVTNMLARDTVREVALLLGYEHTCLWLEEHPDLYSQAVFRGLAVEDPGQETTDGL